MACFAGVAVDMSMSWCELERYSSYWLDCNHAPCPVMGSGACDQRPACERTRQTWLPRCGFGSAPNLSPINLMPTLNVHVHCLAGCIEVSTILEKELFRPQQVHANDPELTGPG